MCIYTHAYIYIYIYTHTYKERERYVYIHIHIYVPARTGAPDDVYDAVAVFVQCFIHTVLKVLRVYIYIYIYIYTHTHSIVCRVIAHYVCRIIVYCIVA